MDRLLIFFVAGMLTSLGALAVARQRWRSIDRPMSAQDIAEATRRAEQNLCFHCGRAIARPAPEKRRFTLCEKLLRRRLLKMHGAGQMRGRRRQVRQLQTQ